MARKQLTSNGHKLDVSAETFGELRESNDCLHDVSLLRERMAEDGYLFIRGFLDPQWVLDARQQVVEWLAKEGLLNPDYPVSEAVAAPHANTAFTPEERLFPAVRKLTHSGRMIEFYAEFLGAEVRAY